MALAIKDTYHLRRSLYWKEMVGMKKMILIIFTSTTIKFKAVKSFLKKLLKEIVFLLVYLVKRCEFKYDLKIFELFT